MDIGWSIVDGRPVGMRCGDPADVAPTAVPARSSASTLRPRWLIVSFSADMPGVYRFDGIRDTYGSGLRRRTTGLPFKVCLDVLPEAAHSTRSAACHSAAPTDERIPVVTTADP